MRSMLTVFPVRRVTAPKSRRKVRTDGFAKMFGKLDAASARLSRARRGR
jgi:hypothetical protein